jgi:hypothetical protein
MIVDRYCGFRDQLDNKPGDIYRCREGSAVQNGGRPPKGNVDGEGYAERPLCAKDFWVIVRVRNGVLESVEPKTEKKPFIPD